MKSVKLRRSKKNKGQGPAITTQIINFGKILRAAPSPSNEFFHFGTRLAVVNAKIKRLYPNPVPKELQEERVSLQKRLKPIGARLSKTKVKQLKEEITKIVTNAGLAKAA